MKDVYKKLILSNDSIGCFCDRGIVFSLCAMIFVLPASIALLNSFAGLAIFLYLFKKISRIIIDWPLRASCLNFLGRIHFIWEGFAPIVNPLAFPLKFLVLAIFISVLFSQYLGLSLVAFIGKFIKCLFLYFSFIETFRNERRIRIFLSFFLVSAFITALSGIVQHYTGKDFIRGHLMFGGRLNSSFYTANGFGAYLLPVLGIVTHFLYSTIMRKKSLALGVLFAVLLVLFLVCLCGTYSRSSWVGYFVMLFVMVFLDRRKALFAGALLLVLIFIFSPSLKNARNVQLFSDNSSVQRKASFQESGFILKQDPIHSVKLFLEQGGSGRFTFWSRAILIIRSSPIYGTGLNTYGRIVNRDSNPEYAHNSYLQMTAETGLVGLSCFLWVLFVLLRHGLYYCQQIKDLWPCTLLQGIVSGLIGFLVQAVFDNTFYTVQLSILMWLIFGLMVAVTNAFNKHRGGSLI